MREGTDLLLQVRAIDGLKLRDIDYTWPRQVPFPSAQPDISWERGMAQVGGERYHYHGVEAATVEPIVLQDEGWPAAPWF